MLRIPCPWCGERDEVEFRYRGDATRTRPAADAAPAAFLSYVYERDNPCDWHTAWWLHVGGCRKLLRVVRHTLTARTSCVSVWRISIDAGPATRRARCPDGSRPHDQLSL